MKKILINCTRFFELNYLFQTDLLNQMIELDYKIHLIVRSSSLKAVNEYILRNNLDIEVHEEEKKLNNLYESLISALNNVFYLSHPYKKINETVNIHREQFIYSNLYKKSFRKYIFVYLTILMYSLNSKFIFIKKLLKKLNYYLVNLKCKNKTYSIIKKIDPDLCIAFSLSLGLDDTVFLIEASQNKIKTLVLIQSWDRTSNKGIPIFLPDFISVWNNFMYRECLEMNIEKAQIRIDGSPIFDKIIEIKNSPDEKNFFKNNFNIDEFDYILFFAAGSLNQHEINLKILPQIKIWLDKQNETNKKKIYLIVRPYPWYYSSEEENKSVNQMKKEFLNMLDDLKQSEFIKIFIPDYLEFDGTYIGTMNDREKLQKTIKFSSLNLCQSSSFLVESAFYNVPVVNIEIGSVRNEKYNIDFSNYYPAHLKRVYSYNFIYRVSNLKDLYKNILHVLVNPSERQTQRRIVVSEFNSSGSEDSSRNILSGISSILQ